MNKDIWKLFYSGWKMLLALYWKPNCNLLKLQCFSLLPIVHSYWKVAIDVFISRSFVNLWVLYDSAFHFDMVHSKHTNAQCVVECMYFLDILSQFRSLALSHILYFVSNLSKANEMIWSVYRNSTDAQTISSLERVSALIREWFHIWIAQRRQIW